MDPFNFNSSSKAATARAMSASAQDINEAAFSGDEEGISCYLEQGGDPNYVNKEGVSLLHSCSVNGHTSCVRLLLEAGADTDLKVCQGRQDASPLLLAVLNGHSETVSALLTAGAEVGAKNMAGLTPLHVACLKANVELVEVLLRFGADHHARDKKKKQPAQLIGKMVKCNKDSEAENQIAMLLEGAEQRRKALINGMVPPDLPSPRKQHQATIPEEAVLPPPPPPKPQAVLTPPPPVLEMTSGLVLGSDYTLEKALCCSSGANVLWTAEKASTGEECVIKRCNSRAAFDRERAVLKHLQQESHGEQLSIRLMGLVMEHNCLVLARGGRNLREIGNRLRVKFKGGAYMDRVKPYCRQVVEVCQYLHQRALVWGDVKPENFVENADGELMAIDFDSACVISGSAAGMGPAVPSTFSCQDLFTPNYAAPERAKAALEKAECLASKAQDVFSVGMVLYWLITGTDYFEGSDDATIMSLLADESFAVSLSGIDASFQQAHNLLATLLSPAPLGRGSLDSCMSRAFFAGGASISAATLHLEKRLDGVTSALQSTIREESGSLREELAARFDVMQSSVDSLSLQLKRVSTVLDHLVTAEGELPKLIFVSPAEGSPSSWDVKSWFSNAVRLQFVCAVDLQPMGEGFIIPQPKELLEKWGPALQAAAFVLVLGVKVGALAVGINAGAVDSFYRAVACNIVAAKQISDVLNKVTEEMIHAGLGGGTPELPTVPTDLSDETLERSRELTGASYEELKAYLDKHHKGWRASLKESMVRSISDEGKVEWVCHRHATEAGAPVTQLEKERYRIDSTNTADVSPVSTPGSVTSTGRKKGFFSRFGRKKSSSSSLNG